MYNFEELINLKKKVLVNYKIENHPLFIRLNEREFSEVQVKEIALQFYQVVLHFPRFLAAILANIPDYKVRMPLVDNLYEEHGKLNDLYVHSNTYRTFLTGLGISDNEIVQSAPIVAVVAYNRAVTDLCFHYPFEEGLAALGIIEEIVARVSPIVAAFVQSGLTNDKKELFHFTSHQTLDITHANEIYEIVAGCWNPGSNDKIVRGLTLGAYYHTRLYFDIYDYANGLNITEGK